VKFLADDDRFGVVVTPAGCRHMYQFRLVPGGRLIGGAAAVVEPPAYDPLVEMARVYWAKLEAAAGPGT
jgi:hypothetical protein